MKNLLKQQFIELYGTQYEEFNKGTWIMKASVVEIEDSYLCNNDRNQNLLKIGDFYIALAWIYDDLTISKDTPLTEDKIIYLKDFLSRIKEKLVFKNNIEKDLNKKEVKTKRNKI